MRLRVLVRNLGDIDPEKIHQAIQGMGKTYSEEMGVNVENVTMGENWVTYEVVVPDIFFGKNDLSDFEKAIRKFEPEHAKGSFLITMEIMEVTHDQH